MIIKIYIAVENNLIIPMLKILIFLNSYPSENQEYSNDNCSN